MEPVLLACGLAAIAIGAWRGYANARAVVAPLAHPGEAPPTTVEATRPVAEGARVRQAARNLVASVAWLVLAMYGLFLVASAEAAR
jgi:small neutral amino acid transporter SnatA (MarC family)